MIHRRRRGFTLLEILVVLVIIGIIAAVATISVNVLGRDSEIEDQSQRLTAVMTEAKQEAELQGREMGVLIDRTGYEFLWFDALRRAWQPIDNDDLLAPRQLPDGLSIRLWMEGREVILKPHEERAPAATGEETKPKDAEETDAKSSTTSQSDLGTVDSGPQPQITLLSSGEINSFELRIEREGTDHVWRIASQLDNSLLAEEQRDDR